MYFGTKPYGLEGLIEHRGVGAMYRGENFGQPRTLVPGDVLASGHEIAKEWSEQGNGGVGLHFTDGTMRTIAARVPLLLAGGNDGKYPVNLESGDIFETGCVVLAEPTEIDTGDPSFQYQRSEVRLSLTGGISGHTVGVPRDLVIALHNEQYPPAPETDFGSFVISNTLGMGAYGRRNLPDYGRLDGQPEPERVANVFDRISALRATAIAERAAYQGTIELLEEQCKQLKGVELLITGRLQGRGGTMVGKDDPRAWVENMLVEVQSARVNTYEGHGSLVAGHLPFIEFHGWTVSNNELVSAWMGVGKFGVSVADPNAQSQQR